jgi:hypothetical protein
LSGAKAGVPFCGAVSRISLTLNPGYGIPYRLIDAAVEFNLRLSGKPRTRIRKSAA